MKILYTATVLSHICQFHLHHFKMLKDEGHEIHVAAHDNLALKNGLKLQYADQFHEVCFHRSPLKLVNLKAYKQLKKLIDQEHYDLIVCNTPMGGIVTRLAARKARKSGTKVVYIAHGFHFYKGAPKKNWLVFYPIEKFFSRLTDTIVTIVEEDHKLVKAKFHCNVEHIHGIGVSPDRYHPVDAQTAREMRIAEGLTDNDFVILCVGELNKNKNQITLIKAAELLKDSIPNLKILLAGNGPLEDVLKREVSQRRLIDQIKFLGYRTDLEKITPAVNLVVSCSMREGLPLNILEAMLCAKPVVASDNRGHRELVKNNENGFIVQPADINSFAKQISELYKDSNLRNIFGNNAKVMSSNYESTAVTAELKNILL